MDNAQKIMQKAKRRSPQLFDFFDFSAHLTHHLCGICKVLIIELKCSYYDEISIEIAEFGSAGRLRSCLICIFSFSPRCSDPLAIRYLSDIACMKSDQSSMFCPLNKYCMPAEMFSMIL